MKRLIRQLKWRWILIGALLIIGRFTLVWAGNVSTNIEDTGTNVGIGTTSPGAKLTVAGTSVAQPSSGTSSTAISRIRGSNGAVLDFGSASDIGIGTTSPGAKLTVAGTSVAQPSSGTSSTAISRIRGSNGAVLDFGSAS